jgi:hypothetical protein
MRPKPAGHAARPVSPPRQASLDGTGRQRSIAHFAASSERRPFFRMLAALSRAPLEEN